MHDDDRLCHQLALANLAVAQCHAQLAEDASKVSSKLLLQMRSMSDASQNTSLSTDRESLLAHMCDGIGHGGSSNASTGNDARDGIWKYKAHATSAGAARACALRLDVSKTAAAVLLHGQGQPVELKDA